MNDTITAISTAVGNSGISIIRISGDEAFNIAGKLMKLSSTDVEKIKTHTIKYGHIYNEAGIVDEVLVSFMKAPKTYTREDVVEINCHGGAFITKKVLETAIKAGARLAEPGEFTKRAFLSGRIDLTQAEAVMDIIRADSDYAIKSAGRRLNGGIGDKLKPVKDSILTDMAYIEAALDDPEHMSLDGKAEEIRKNVVNNINALNNILENAGKGRIIKEGIKTVIVGKPNVGKSSFLNYISGEEVAIVTDIPGTTRDALLQNVSLGDISLNIVDTAGIRETDNEIERMGIERAKEHLSDADLVLMIIDVSKPLSTEDKGLLAEIKSKKTVLILNKTDLEIGLTDEEYKEFSEFNLVEISAKKRIGIEKLTEIIKEMFFNGELDFNNEIYLSNLRQEGAIRRAEESLNMVLESIDSGVSEDFYTIDLMNAYNAIGEVTGDTTSEDLADKIFKDFCMGK